MASAVDVAVPAVVAAASAAATYLLGRRGQQSAEEDRAYAQAWRLVEELRAELDRTRAGLDDRLAEAQAECHEQVERLREDHDRALTELRRQLRQETARANARALVAMARERYWYRAANGQPIPGERPPPEPGEEP